MIIECHVVWAHALLFCSERWEKILNLNSVHTDNSILNTMTNAVMFANSEAYRDSKRAQIIV